MMGLFNTGFNAGTYAQTRKANVLMKKAMRQGSSEAARIAVLEQQVAALSARLEWCVNVIQGEVLDGEV